MNKKMLNHVRKYNSVMDDSSKFKARRTLNKQLIDLIGTLSKLKKANIGDLEEEIAAFEADIMELELAIKSISNFEWRQDERRAEEMERLVT
jgi:SMC interacting uncharacterized protein involved in chromosome segregation